MNDRSIFLKTEGFVLKKKLLLNKDLLIFFFTKEKGKILVLAKGVRKITSRRSSYLETGNLVEVILNKKNDKYYLKEINLVSGFYNLKKNKDKINFIYKFFFVLDKILPENQKEIGSYNLTKSFFIKINQNDIKDNILYQFINKLLLKLGYLKENINKDEIDDFFFQLTNEKIPSFII